MGKISFSDDADEERKYIFFETEENPMLNRELAIREALD